MASSEGWLGQIVRKRSSCVCFLRAGVFWNSSDFCWATPRAAVEVFSGGRCPGPTVQFKRGELDYIHFEVLTFVVYRGRKRHMNIWHINNFSVTPGTDPPGREPDSSRPGTRTKTFIFLGFCTQHINFWPLATGRETPPPTRSGDPPPARAVTGKICLCLCALSFPEFRQTNLPQGCRNGRFAKRFFVPCCKQVVSTKIGENSDSAFYTFAPQTPENDETGERHQKHHFFDNPRQPENYQTHSALISLEIGFASWLGLASFLDQWSLETSKRSRPPPRSVTTSTQITSYRQISAQQLRKPLVAKQLQWEFLSSKLYNIADETKLLQK